MSLQKLTRTALIAAAIGATAAVIAAITRPELFLRAYLAAFTLCIAVPLGSAAVLMTHHLATGRWGKALRPSLESAISTMPLLPIFFIPIALGVRHLYPWTDPARVAADRILQHQHPYLNLPFFFVRAIIYFATWILGAHLLVRWSSQRDPASKIPHHKLQTLCAVGLLVYATTITFAAYDWLASLEPHWFSSVFGLYLLIGQASTGFALLVLLLVLFSRKRALSPDTLHDFGNLMLMLVVLHTYLSFSQFFITWNGNTHSEIAWYVARTTAGWGPIATLIVITDFALPFAALLFRVLKRTPAFLGTIAAIMLLARLIEAPWMVLPSFGPARPLPIAIVAASILALGGIWFALFARIWSRTPLIFTTAEEHA